MIKLYFGRMSGYSGSTGWDSTINSSLSVFCRCVAIILSKTGDPVCHGNSAFLCKPVVRQRSPVLVAVMWLIPDRRIEMTISSRPAGSLEETGVFRSGRKHHERIYPVDERNKHAGTWLLTVVAMTAFATNSVLCRMALGAHAIDAASFTALRLVSGALALTLLSLVLRGSHALAAGSWVSGIQLCLYAVAFSFAYISLSAGTGSLILFGAVQATMIIAGLRAGERPHPLQWTGLVTALAGLIYLVLPGMAAPSLRGALLWRCPA